METTVLEAVGIDAVIAEFLEEHPDAIVLEETIKGIPLIFDQTREQLDKIVGFTGIAYPMFADLYDTVPSGYTFHAVDVHTQMSASHILSESVS
jgi:hypothetical protein